MLAKWHKLDLSIIRAIEDKCKNVMDYMGYEPYNPDKDWFGRLKSEIALEDQVLAWIETELFNFYTMVTTYIILLP